MAKPEASPEDHAKGCYEERLSVRAPRARGDGRGSGISTYLTPISRPIRLIVELLRIPHRLEQDLWQPHGMGRRTWAAGLKGAGFGVRDVFAVVGGVEVDAVPACAIRYESALTSPRTAISSFRYSENCGISHELSSWKRGVWTYGNR